MVREWDGFGSRWIDFGGGEGGVGGCMKRVVGEYDGEIF